MYFVGETDKTLARKSFHLKVITTSPVQKSTTNEFFNVVYMIKYSFPKEDIIDLTGIQAKYYQHLHVFLCILKANCYTYIIVWYLLSCNW